MPVIGRLDQQVEDLIISPVSKKRPHRPAQTRDDEDEHSQPPTGEAPAADTPGRPREESLPVWLL